MLMLGLDLLYNINVPLLAHQSGPRELSMNTVLWN